MLTLCWQCLVWLTFLVQMFIRQKSLKVNVKVLQAFVTVTQIVWHKLLIKGVVL